MPNDNVQTLVTQGVLPSAYLDLQAFINQINSLTADEVQALVDLRDQVSGLQVQHEGGIDPQFC